MLIIHEALEKEARHVYECMQSAYGLAPAIKLGGFSSLFSKVPIVDLYVLRKDLKKELVEHTTKEAAILLTERELWVDANTWTLGCSQEDVSILSVRRLRRHDDAPSLIQYEDDGTYLSRIGFLAVHLVGHHAIKGDHLKETYWVDAKTGEKSPLGPHCRDSTCAMYETLTVPYTPEEAGWIEIGGEKMHDVGIDTIVKNLWNDWFCDSCRKAIKIKPATDARRI
jgi:hypothetical protein